MSAIRRLIETWVLPPGLLLLLKTIKGRLRILLLSAESKRLLANNRQLKDRHTGSRCFILGAGSSIKDQNIAKLEGEIVISVSNTFVHPDFPRIKPRYHVSPALIQSHGNIFSEQKFVAWLRAMEASTGDAEMFFHIGDREMIERNNLFNHRIVHWVEYIGGDIAPKKNIDLSRVPSIGSVSELALTVAVYLGFDKIYLLGIDHDWFNGSLIFFYDHNKQHEMKPNAEALSFADSEFQMRRHAEIFKRYKYLYSLRKNIYNANAAPNHYLDVFPKVDYDTLFIPPEKAEKGNEHPAATPHTKDGKSST